MTTLAVSGLSGPGFDTYEVFETMRKAADWGYGAAWLAEVQGPDAISQLGALAVTTDMDLGVAVVPVQTRSAMSLAMSALSVQELSRGRFTLGIGASSETIVSKWAGQPFDKPLTHVRETFDAIYPVLKGEASQTDGEYVQMRYRPYRDGIPRVPLYLGALNQKSLQQVGELGADGLCLNQMGAEHVPQMLDLVREGAGGALPDDFGVVARLFCFVTDDVAAARPMIKHIFAPYIATSVYNRFYRWMGYEADARGVMDKQGDRDAQAASISDRLVDDIFLLGTPERIAGRVKEFVDAGVTVPVIAPLSMHVHQAADQLEAIGRAWNA
ncbi:MAG: LLM class flavin-dependent oxidoreductase [Nitriliruptorales bacterium]|nr:LLM class flavin-dependent oxidoreductase [Nitriliruptorales bacterium]